MEIILIWVKVMKRYSDKKTNMSVTVRNSTLTQLREHKKQHGITISWLVDTLLDNYLNSWSELKYEEETAFQF